MAKAYLYFILLFAYLKSIQCCVPLLNRPGEENNTTSTPEISTTSIPLGGLNETTEEKASTTFSVLHNDLVHSCTYDFTYNLNSNVNILTASSSQCTKSSEGKATTEFLGQHDFKVMSKDGIEFACSLAVIYVKIDDTIELVDNVIQDSMTCSVIPGTCLTQDGPHFYSKCSFPFIFNGRKFQACTDWPQTTKETKEDGLWCATQTDEKMVMDEGHWGWCSSSCGYCGGKDVIASTGPSTSINSSVCKTETGKTCIFPFIDGGQTHTKCADWKSKYFWCSTSVNSDLISQSWEKCDMSSCEENETEGDCKTVSGPSTGMKCIFPFKDGDKEHQTCIDWKGKQWCATSLNIDGSFDRWGYCDEDICPLQTTRGGIPIQPSVRGLEKCGYDCLVNTKKQMVSKEQVANEELTAPVAIFEKENLSNASYNYLSDTRLQFIAGQKGIILRCMNGRFTNFAGENEISVSCNGDGIFRVTGQANGEIWENAENSHFGCNPCPGYNSLMGSMEDNPVNTIGIQFNVVTMLDCLYLCEESENGCQVFQFSLEKQLCTLYKELDLKKTNPNDLDLVCFAPCDCGCEDNERVGPLKGHEMSSFKKKATKKGKKNTVTNHYSYKHQIPLLITVQANYDPGKYDARPKYGFVAKTGVWDSKKELGTPKVGKKECIPSTKKYTHKGFDRGHVFGDELIRYLFGNLPANELLYLEKQMVNIIPQHALLNQHGEWRDREDQILAFIKKYLKKDYTVLTRYAVIPGPNTLSGTIINIPSKIIIGVDAKKLHSPPDKILFEINNPEDGLNVVSKDYPKTDYKVLVEKAFKKAGTVDAKEIKALLNVKSYE